MQSTALVKRLRAEDIMVQTGSGAMAVNGCFQKNMLKALKFKEAESVTWYARQRNSSHFSPRSGREQSTVTKTDRAQFLKRASTQTTSAMLTFSKKLPWNGIAFD